MADTEKTLDVLSSLPFGKYDDEWVKNAWEKDFTDIDPLSLELENDLGENDYHIETLHKVCSVFDTWIHEKKGSREEGFWTVLVENDLSYKNFTAFLAYLMEVGHRREANSHQREAGLLAASNYFKLVTIPGSGAFKLFHPMLFQRGMDMLKSWTTLSSGQRKRQANISSSQLSSKQGRGKRAKRSTMTQDPVLEFSDEDDEEGHALTGAEINRIKKAILSLLKDFIQLLENFSLNQSDSSSHYAVSVLSELTNVDPELFDGDFERANLSGMPVSGLSYKGLMKLLSPAHGDIVALTTSVFKHLLPRILMLIGENKGVAAQAIPRSVLLSKDHAVNFVCFLLKGADESVVSVVRILLQHMCAKVPDKAEYRTNVAQAVVKILKELSGKHYVTMLEWISKFSRNGKNSYRAFSLDVTGLLLKEPVRAPSDDIPEDQLMVIQQRFLVEIVLARCSDLSPTVRARAIAAFGHCLTSGSAEILSAVQEIVTPKPVVPNAAFRQIPTPEIARSQQLTENEPPVPAPDLEPVRDVTVVNPATDLPQDTPALNIPTPAGAKRETPVLVDLQTPQVNVCLRDPEGVTSMLRRRASDEKVMVRKAALQTLESAIRLAGPAYKQQDVEVLKDRCRDPALSVRRSAMQSLTDLLKIRPQDRLLQSAWLDGVLPMVMDRETSAQERCLETLEELVLHNVVPFHRTCSADYGLVWDLLDIIAGDSGVELRRFLQKACQHWSREGKIKTSLINSLKTHINQENDAGAWLLLAEIAPSCTKFNHEFVLDYWKKKGRVCEASQYSTCQRVLSVLGYIAPQLAKDDRKELIDDLKTKLLAFEFPPELVAVTVSTLCKLCDSEGKSVSEKEKWCTELLFASDTYLSDLILDENQVDLPDENKVVRHLFTLGEIAQLCPANTPKRVFMLVESLIAAPCITAEDSCDSQPEGSPEVSPASSQAVSDSQRSQSSQTSRGSQMSQGTQSSAYRQSTQVLSQFRGSKMSSKIRAHAFITLGKLCLQNEDVAKKCVSALARELEISPDPAIRNNVVVILCDLCIRYTTLVDRHVVNIAACLKDNSALVRKQTLTLLTRLLQEDFLKWKGVLFYRFITSLLDENKDISSFAEFCLVHILLQRNPNMFFHHFVECVFHFNGYEGHSVYNKFQQSDREKQMFSLKGPTLFSKRHKLYTFMLEHMADDQRFKLTAKLCQDVLSGVVDNILPLTVETSQLLKDTLNILCCKEIKLASLRTKPHDDVMDEQDMAAVVMATAKKTLITQVVKRNVIENIVPIVTSLKHFLEKHRSPVLKQLMMYLRELMKDYKDEVKDILSADKQLATEIEYDLRKFEEQETNPQAAVGAAGSLPSPRTGGSKPGSPSMGRGSPRSASGSPKTTSPRAPANNSLSPTANTSSMSGTPALTRQISLSTMAILNSAKKAMDKVKTVRDARNSPHKATPDRRPVHKAARGPSDSDENRTITEAPVTALFKTPDNSGKNRRAISTPTSVLGNITFHQDQNISLIPPSPIPTALPIRVYGEQQSVSDSSAGDSSKPATRARTTDRDVVFMFSPDKPLPKPRSWKITATPPRKNPKERNEEPEEASEKQRPQRRVSSRLRSSSQSSS